MAAREPLAVGDFDDFYGAPVVDGLRASAGGDSSTPEIWSSPIEGGPDLLSYVSVADPSTLYVTFHGAVRLETDRYPRFDRVGSSAKLGRSIVAFADPSLLMSSTLRLAWYLGGIAWDPLESMAAVVRRVSEQIAAERIVLVGGSGGGFAAMRLGQHFPDALVYAFSPQSAVLDYHPVAVNEYFTAAYPEEDPEAVVQGNLARFSMQELYSRLGEVGPALYYLQSTRDPKHVVGHYEPMKARLGVTGKTGHSPGGNVRFMTYSAKRPGHGPPTPDEYEFHLAKALRLQDRVRAARHESATGA